MSNKRKDYVRIFRGKEKADQRFSLIKLETPYGYLAGKWWGPKNVRPILCLHGWMDNCGSFDKLIPLLPQEQSYLAFDLPGHGLSSRYREGMIYSYYDIIVLIERIRREYQWDKISLLGHSLGAFCCFFYSAMYPENVDLFVALDSFEPFIRSNLVYIFRWNLAKLLNEEDRKFESEPEAFDYQELLDRLITGSKKSLNRESAELLLARNIKRSKKYPNKYFFAHDRRILGMDRVTRTSGDIMEFAKEIVCPILYCRGEDSWILPQNFQQTATIREHLVANNPNYSFLMGPGNHHFPLTHPEAYSEEISRFVRKHRPIKGKL